YNILINTVSPGFVLTDLTKKNLSESEMKQLESQIPIGRMAKPEEIAKVVLFLASEYNTYLTGQNIIVDGGFVNV
ncbi:SDR family NAD(P)-dependent oxidoreductase, partial [Leptospira adleri]|uniref:SDR family NAD(P)-dependent oxidoreductase n=1 Tax=Leptospira adleri TaxID=2023186 RepID=UPI0010834EBA